jgi:outer membrane protein TolC
VSSEFNQLTTAEGVTWGLGPSVSWTFPNQAGPRARIRQAKANAQAALEQFDGTVLQALKETEQALAAYVSELDRRQALLEAQEKAQRAFTMAHDQFVAGALSNLELLSTEQSLVTADAASATSDAALVQDQIAVFKALGGGWE